MAVMIIVHNHTQKTKTLTTYLLIGCTVTMASFIYFKHMAVTFEIMGIDREVRDYF